MLFLKPYGIRHWRTSVFVVIIETSFFTRRIIDLMSDDEYRAMQQSLIIRPDTGPIIQGTGGLRKVRWRMDGHGKSSGVRIIYYWLTAEEQIYMLYAYAKNEREDLTQSQKQQLRQIVEKWSDE